MECRFYIKRFLLGVLVAIGLLYAYFAYANPPQEFKSAYFYDIKKTTVYNSGGIPNDRDWEAFEKERAAVEARQKANLAKNTQGYSSRIRCSCVLYIKAITGYSTPVGAARNWPINSLIPQKGAVVVFTGGAYGHVALVGDVNLATNTFRVETEANQSKCQVTSGRIVRLDDPSIKGYWVINS